MRLIKPQLTSYPVSVNFYEQELEIIVEYAHLDLDLPSSVCEVDSVIEENDQDLPQPRWISFYRGGTVSILAKTVTISSKAQRRRM
jgi:hypothetical protein